MVEAFQCRTNTQFYNRCIRFHSITGSTSSSTVDSLGNDETVQIPKNLKSSMGIDYVPLATMLAAGDFKSADQFTRDNLLRLAGADQQQRQFVFWTEVKSISSVDLATMERLWLVFSAGKFGYSVQKRVWEQEEGNFPRFTRRIGWTISETHHNVGAYANPITSGSDEKSSPPPSSALAKKKVFADGYLHAGEERLRKWFGASEFMYDLHSAPKGHLPLTSALRGTQLLKQLLLHSVWEQYDWLNYQSVDWGS